MASRSNRATVSRCAIAASLATNRSAMAPIVQRQNNWRGYAAEARETNSGRWHQVSEVSEGSEEPEEPEVPMVDQFLRPQIPLNHQK